MEAPFTEPWYRDPRARQPVAVGVALVASGLLHAAAWAIDGTPWEGPVTWRKPILFGISGGLTSLSIGWVWARLAPRWGDTCLAAACAWALFVEVFLIDLQCWRGVASHFNRSTPLDSLVYDVMGGLILFVTIVIADLTVRAYRDSLEGWPADMRLAARAGMLLLIVSCGLGIWASVHGDMQMTEGLAPERYGLAGVTKFPHGVVIHAIQWLPLLAWAARKARCGETARWWLVAVASVASVLMLAFALAQTLTGHSRFDITWWAQLLG